MEKEPKPIDPFGLSRLKSGEQFIGNFPTETISDYRKRGEIHVNEEVERMRESGKWESVRTHEAYDKDGEKILGMRAIFAKPKAPQSGA